MLISGASQPWLANNAILRNGRANLAAHDGARPALVGNVFDKVPLDLPPDVKMETVRGLNYFLDLKPAKPAREQGAPQVRQP